jgi:hypothetical protein
MNEILLLILGVVLSAFLGLLVIMVNDIRQEVKISSAYMRTMHDRLLIIENEHANCPTCSTHHERVA